MLKYIIICIIICIIILILLFALRVAFWAKKMLHEGRCPICIIKQHLKKSHITMPIPDEFYDNDAAETPPMGWSSWNTFHNHIDETLILETADALVKTGLADAGYRFVNLDDCWQSSMRTPDGKLQGDLSKFPNGISSLVEKINEKGLKVGIYSSNGTYTCEDLPASLGHEKTDAETFAEWGIEYFKYDYCHEKKIPSEAPLVSRLEIEMPSGRLTLTAEEAALSGIAKRCEDKRLATGSYIAFLGYGKGCAAFRFDAECEGDYPLTVVIKKCGQYEKYAVLQLNDTYYELFFPSTSAWSVDGRFQICVHIEKGENQLRLFNPVCTRADSTYIQYKRMGEELKKASKERKIVYSICEHGKNNPKDWAWNVGNLWRTTPDIAPYMKWINIIYERNLPLAHRAGAGHWNDPDMLEVGNGKLTAQENQSHFSLWCMMAAPLILGNDIRLLLDGSCESEKLLRIIKNETMIGIDQDKAGRQCVRYKKSSGIDYLIKELSDGRAAVCLYNRKKRDTKANFSFADLPENYCFKPQKIREIWSEMSYEGAKFVLPIPSGGCAVFILK